LDELRNIAHHGKEYLLKLQQQEAERTGISSLKISYNNVFGYYLEVTNVHKNKVPADWMRKQTLANAERYITPELKEYEEKITGAEEKILELELQLFDSLINELFDFLYFSAITILTIGYGDIIPNSPITRKMVMAEAFFGTISLTLFLSLFFSILLTNNYKKGKTVLDKKTIVSSCLIVCATLMFLGLLYNSYKVLFLECGNIFNSKTKSVYLFNQNIGLEKSDGESLVDIYDKTAPIFIVPPPAAEVPLSLPDFEAQPDRIDPATSTLANTEINFTLFFIFLSPFSLYRFIKKIQLQVFSL
jgi:hypothetical protein